MVSQPSRYSDAVAHGNPDATADMAAPRVHPHDSATGINVTNPVALVTTTAHKFPDPDSNPYQKWDGKRTTLAPFLTELEMNLSAHDSALYTFAVEYYVMLQNGKTVLAHPGQAAQLDGNLHRPAYTWDNPAPENADAYAVDHLAIVNAVHATYAELRLLKPDLPDTPPTVPMGSAYPIDTSLYMRSLPMMTQHDKRLRAFVLELITSPSIKFDLARRFSGGRALLAHLRHQAAVPLTSSEVRAILDKIDALVSAGLPDDTAEAFTAFTTNYYRLLQCIPEANGARDTDATTAMRYVQVVVHNRPDIGQAVMTHLRSGNVNQNDPTEVGESLLTYLNDTEHMRRLMRPAQAPPAPATVAVADVLTALDARPDPIKTSNEPTNDATQDKLALVTASLTQLASRAESDATALCAVCDVVTTVPRSGRSA